MTWVGNIEAQNQHDEAWNGYLAKHGSDKLAPWDGVSPPFDLDDDDLTNEFKEMFR